MIVDSHCHLTYEPMSQQLRETVEEQIKMVLSICLQFQQKIKVLKKY